MSRPSYSRGSEWRQWDLHIHSPASFHWSGQRFHPDLGSETNKPILDQMIGALNTASPEVFGLMDYWTFNGWFALKKRLSEPDAPKLLKTVFPGIELRLLSPSKSRLNAHVLFSDETPEQDLKDFLSKLKVELVEKPLSDAALISLSRQVAEDKLLLHGFKKSEVDGDDFIALRAGSTIAEINCDSYKKAISEVPDGNAIGFMPYDTSDGLKEVDWKENYAYFIGLFKSSPIFESRNLELRDAFLNITTDKNAKWIKNFQHGLGNTPRLVVSGSDAHQFVGPKTGNDQRGYGDFPSSKITWIKADPTFQGLLQAIKEPAKRSYIGQIPPKLEEVRTSPTNFIESVEIQSMHQKYNETWLDRCKVEINKDLVAIIGNKGSGKSALADIIALLGNTRQGTHFTFLKRDRFRGKTGDPAKNFQGKLNWIAGDPCIRNLNENPPQESVERVRYIPQGHFEELCNEHVSGTLGAFERELRAVIFAHTDEPTRLGANSFDELIERQEITFRDQLSDARRRLDKIIDETVFIQRQLDPSAKKSLEELLNQKKEEISEYLKLKPSEVPQPSGELTAEQKAAAELILGTTSQLAEMDQEAAARSKKRINIAAKKRAIQEIRERIRHLEREYQRVLAESSEGLALLGLEFTSLVTIQSDATVLDALNETLNSESEGVEEADKAEKDTRIALLKSKDEQQRLLNGPQLAYQEYQTALANWNERVQKLRGTPDDAESLVGIQSRIDAFKTLPLRLAELTAAREGVVTEIYGVLDAQRRAREALFGPVQELIRTNQLIREDYKLQFLATLGGAIEQLSGSLFSLIKQNSGEFRGEDESLATVKKLCDTNDFNTIDGALGFSSELATKIEKADSSGGLGLNAILRKDKTPQEVYSLIFGLGYLEPRYTLQFQETQIEQLSPGQRGALLLIFYLLVDKGRSPIVLDQPEENLDNETVVSLLVPVLTEAKKHRQIVMVTHNPNLAVVCDAEQVIYASFDRKNGSRIGYHSGSIENPQINKCVVDVLEGTMPAFSNRRDKYHKAKK